MRSPLPFLAASRCWSLPLLAASFLLGPGTGPASAQSPAPKPNLLADNGGFEKASPPSENLWDGVNSDGTLGGFTLSPPVVTDKGSIAGVAMPPSVAFVDLNGDGKPDLITADPTGFFRFYPNVGTATEPKFTNAEIIPIFVSTTFAPREWDWQTWGNDEYQRMCPRVSIADWRRSGSLDLLIGNYFGEVFFLPNTGSNRAPVYKVPVASVPNDGKTTGEALVYRNFAAGITAARVQTHDQNRFWGNLFAPVAANWGSNGRPDLIVGEGTYSANTIHLLSNVGTDSTPKFSNSKHTSIAYGDGREQLIPTIGDFNGDGNPDLVISDRTGEVGMYLNPGKPDPNVELKRSSTISFGAKSNLGGATAPFAADFNGDGLLDLLIGLPNGHIAVSLNTGTKTEPKFGPLVDLKGTPKFGRSIKLPQNWKLNLWRSYGHALAYATVVTAQDDPTAEPPEGTSCLKAGYSQLTGQTFPMPTTNIPGAIRHFTLLHEGLTLTQNKSYKLSFKVKGAGMEKMRYELETRFRGHPGLDKIEKDERGGAKHAAPLVDEWVHIGNSFTCTDKWTNVEATLVPKYKDAALRNEPTMPMKLYVEFFGTSTASQIYFDDFKLVEQ